ncbi:uncharacterized protein LOC112600005 [Melanaphis sacchari]|uniref:uncharacterized protein LOC112600005 n=1 Tax=Melanaphis sacchari TaxID=742174 RepID=UPI000DC134CA|nr:uncharacterized protein LOC112600005 [Melanaphis sacchari]
MWDGVKIVHGKPRHSQTQGSIERANQGFQNILRAMMEDNDTTKWSEALPFVQFAKNTTYHQGIKQTLYEAMFGTKAQRGLLTSSLLREQIEKLATKEELEQILQSVTPQTDPESKGSDENEVEEEYNGKSDDNLDNQANNDEDKLSDKIDGKNQNELLNINEKKENTIKNRALALNGLQTQASVMLRSSNQKFPPAQVGDTVRVRVPDIDRGRMDYQNILAVIMDVDNDLYKLGTKYRIISQLYTRNQFAVCKEKLISLNDVLSNQKMSLRQVSTAASKKWWPRYQKSVPRIFSTTSRDYFDTKIMFLRSTRPEYYWKYESMFWQKNYEFAVVMCC